MKLNMRKRQQYEFSLNKPQNIYSYSVKISETCLILPMTKLRCISLIKYLEDLPLLNDVNFYKR